MKVFKIIIKVFLITLLIYTLNENLNYICKQASAQTIYLSETWSDGNVSPFSPLTVCSDGCEACGEWAVDTTESRPGSGDNYVYHVFPPVGDIATCCAGPRNAFSIGQGVPFYFTFWIKYAQACEWTNAAGKGPELNGTGANRDQRARIVFGPGSTSESWTIPQPPRTGGVFKGFIPTLLIFSNSDGSWHPINATNGLLWSQNINTGNPVYINAGTWYEIKIYVYPHNTQGRVRMWINGTEVLDTQREGYINTIYRSSDHFTTVNPHLLNNDHGGGGANEGFEVWIDDITVIIADDSDTTSPATPTGLRIFD